METYNVCWTGGVDSTYIITYLSQFPICIRPFYIKGQSFRLSETQELEAMAEMREILISDSRTKAELKPVTVIEKDDPRVKDREIIKAHRRIYMGLLEAYKAKHDGKLPPAGSQQMYTDGDYISPQYIACASLAKYLGEPLEVGFQYDDIEHLSMFNASQSIFEKDDITGREVMRIGKETQDKDFYMLFKDIRLSIANKQKKDIWNWYEENYYEKVRAKTISCQEPVIHEDGTWEPCGVCTACVGVIRQNVLEPFTSEGLARYRDFEENHEKEPERFRLKGF